METQLWGELEKQVLELNEWFEKTPYGKKGETKIFNSIEELNNYISEQNSKCSKYKTEFDIENNNTID